MKEAALYMFSLAGPTAYNALQINLKGVFPALSTVRRLLYGKERLQEGKFRFTEIAARIKLRNESPFVCISEDDTKATERLRYDTRNNAVIGLQLPLDINGIPKENEFKFTTLGEVRKFLESAPRATYAKLMTVRTLGPKSSIYTLVVYGTRGSDKSTAVIARWRYVIKCFESIGITVIGKMKILENDFPTYL